MVFFNKYFCRLIAKLSSELFYDNKLACADDAVAESRYRSLSLENIDLSFVPGLKIHFFEYFTLIDFFLFPYFFFLIQYFHMSGIIL